MVLLLKIYYQVKCFYVTKSPEHFHYFDIGVFDSFEKAQQAVNTIESKPGFCEHKEKIKVRKKIRITTPKLLNKIFWEDGFFTYKY